MKLLLKASEEKEHFFDLIYTEVTFANDIIYINGNVMHEKGEKAFISDVEYTAGYWSRLCPDIYVQPKISTFKINGVPGASWKPDTFIEYTTPPPMTPNDKLPETTNEQIKSEAKDIAGKMPVKCDGDVIYKVGYEEGYIAGATAWAPWKVKHEELQMQAQRMADALEELVELKRMSDEEPLSLDYLKRKALAWEAARKAIQQFKDGKEVEPVKEIEYMPIHPDDARKFDCPTQFPMHLLSESQALSNHGQSLQRLKERGGLSVREILAIVGRKNWSYYGGLKWPEAIKMLNDILTNPTK